MEKKKNMQMVIIISLAVILIGLIGFLILRNNKNDGDKIEEETTTTTVISTTAETSSVTETNDMEFLGDYSTDDGIDVRAYSNSSNSIQFNVSLRNDTADNNMQRFETTSSGICDGMVGEYGAPDYIDWWVFCDNKVVFATKSEKQADGTYSFSGVSCADSKYQAAIDDFKNKYIK